MKIVRYKAGDNTRYGIQKGDAVEELAGNPFGKIKTTGRKYKLSELKLLAPCRPSKVVGVGLNYRSHGTETGSKLPEEPLLFLKPTTAIIGPEDNIIYPKVSKRVDFEGELGVVIGKRAQRVSEKKAPDYVLGYTCFNDVSARDLQQKDPTPTRGKGCDTFAPFGPCIETDLDPSKLRIETYLNGERKQDGNTSDLIFSVPVIISYISQVMTLLPGDVIATGTPSGIGPMQPGDTVEVKIEKVGTLRNHVV